MSDITVILPCAGEGSRLGLKSPKELYEITPGTRLIDFSLNHIRRFLQEPPPPAAAGTKLKVAIVTRPWKMAVRDYVAEKLPGIDVEAVMFNDDYSEWPGSVFSAAPCFSAHNLVLLPDSCLMLRAAHAFDNSVYRDEHGDSLVHRTNQILDRYQTVFGAVSCHEPEILTNLGAMRVENNIVTAFQDKPGENITNYNHFWACYGFRKSCARALYDFLIKSVHHEPVSLTSQPFHPAGTIPVASYRDLGTWERIAAFRTDFSLPEPPNFFH